MIGNHYLAGDFQVYPSDRIEIQGDDIALFVYDNHVHVYGQVRHINVYSKKTSLPNLDDIQSYKKRMRMAIKKALARDKYENKSIHELIKLYHQIEKKI